DQPGLGRLRNVVDAEAAAELRRRIVAQALMVHDHDVVGDAHLVGVPARRDLDAAEHARAGRIRDIDDGGAARLLHMAEIERGALDPDLPAAGTVDMRKLTRVLRIRHMGRGVTLVIARAEYVALNHRGTESQRFTEKKENRRWTQMHADRIPAR